MKYLIFVPALFLSFASQAQTKKSSESLSALMGAVSQIIGEKTKIPGKVEKDTKMTPLAAATYKSLENDLENCQTSKTFEPEAVAVEKNGVKVEFKKFDLRIYGDNCPLEMRASVKSTEQTQMSLLADFSVHVVFKKQSFIDKYKLKFIKLNGVISAKAEQLGNVVTIPVSFQLQGDGESTEIGPIQQSMALKMFIGVDLSQFSFNMSSEQTAFLQYQGISKKGYSKVTMAGFSQPEAVYTINDQSVSQSEFQLFLESFTLPGMISDEDPNQPDSKVPTQCTFAVYEKNRISSDALKTQMQAAKLQTEGLLAQGQSCKKDISIPFKKDVNSYLGELKFGTEWISFSSSAAAASDKLSGGVYVLYGDSAVQTNESEELLMGLKCEPSPACQ